MEELIDLEIQLAIKDNSIVDGLDLIIDLPFKAATMNYQRSINPNHQPRDS